MDQSTALYDRFLRGLAKSPGGVAVRSGSAELTYDELHELALTVAGSLLATVDTPPKAIGVLAGKSVESYAGILAALYTGITMVPLQPAFPAARTRQMIEAAGVEALIADPASASALERLRAEGVDLPVVTPSDVDARHRLPRPRPVAPDDVAYILFTSGSTGKPKGVPVIHANTDHYFRLLDERYDFGPEDTFSQYFDLNFDCAMFDLFCAWGCGGTLVAVNQALRELPAFVRDNEITVWFSTPSAISLVRRLGGLHDLDGLRWSFFAGEAITCQDAADWAQAAPNAQLENIYGPTELTITVTRHVWTPESARIAVNGVVPIGLVHAGHDWLLLDPDNTVNLTEGELCIAGPQLTAGYLDPAQDEGRFLVRDGVRFYRTGDRVRRADTGDLLYLGRLDNQVQVHGVRIELAEVDQALRECEGVEDAVTVAVPVDDSVELAAFYTGTPVAPRVLARALGRTLPNAVLPRRFTPLPEFPLNSNRKIDRTVLTRWALEH